LRQSTQAAVKGKFRGRQQLESRVIPHYPHGVEREYQRILTDEMAGLKHTIMQFIPGILAAIDAYRDGGTFNLDDEQSVSGYASSAGGAAFSSYIDREFEKALEEFTQRHDRYSTESALKRLDKVISQEGKFSVNEWKRTVRKTLGLNLLDDYYSGGKFSELYEQWRQTNTDLIKTIPKDSLDRMREIIKEGYEKGTLTGRKAYNFTSEYTYKTGERAGQTVTRDVTLSKHAPTLADQIMAEYKTTENYARFVARDQIAKLNADITRQQQEDAGVREYVWSTSDDRRVRPTHAAMDGKRCKYGDNTVYRNSATDEWKPRTDEMTMTECGHDYQCRCVALAVFDFEDITLPWETPANTS
jgi:SPP1 gp7 family putative phage head morphogenesis protein